MTNQVWVNPDRNNLILQARFARNYGQRLGRFYKRASTVFRFLQIFSGTAAFTFIVGTPGESIWAAWAGLVMAVVSAIDMVWQPGDLASQCNRAAEAWGKLAAQSTCLADDALLERVTELQAMVLPTWQCLINPVFNELMHQTYPPGLMPIGTLQPVTKLGGWASRIC